MTTEINLTIVNIILTSATLTVAWLVYRHSRKKDFQDNLFKIKIEAYKEINDLCYKAYRQLDPTNTPFTQIYDFKEKTEWLVYYTSEVTKMYRVGRQLEKSVYKHCIFLPQNITDKLHEYAGICTSYVTQFAHFDTGLNCETHDRIWELYVDLFSVMRDDLKVERIDRDLLDRITDKVL